MKSDVQKQAGFTLIEMLIVIVVLGIMAMIIVPQITVSSEDARIQTLNSNLKTFRKAVARYYVQHNNSYPGSIKSNGSGPVVNVGQSAEAFVKQLSQYTDAAGKVSPFENSQFIFGPYLKSDTLPLNPFNEKSDVSCDITTTDITSKVSDGATGWKFYTTTGNLIANDGAHDAL